MTFSSLVSIIIPVYNGADYLREAVDSALSQTYRDTEVIVVNDGSDDAGQTESIALSYGDRIRYIVKANGGVASALNAGIRAMRGEYVSWLSHDDMYSPDKIAVQMAEMQNIGQPVILYSDFDYVDSTGHFLKAKNVSRIPDNRFRLSLLTRDPVNGCTTLIPRICFERVGLFDETLKSIQDYDMWFRLAKEYRFVHVPHVLLKSRVHAAQGFRTITGHYRECTEFFVKAYGQLSPHEIGSATDEPLTVFYAQTAVRMKMRGYTEVAEYLLQLSGKALSGETTPVRLRQRALVFVFRIIDKRYKPANWFKWIHGDS